MLLEINIASQIGLKDQKRCIKTTAIEIISWKTNIIWIFYISGDRPWQPLLVSSQPILDFLEPCCLLSYECICIETRGGIYGEIKPEPKGNPKGEAGGIFRGLGLYFIVYPDSRNNTDILNFNSRVGSPYCSSSWVYIFFPYIPSSTEIVLENIAPALLGVYFTVHSQ